MEFLKRLARKILAKDLSNLKKVISTQEDKITELMQTRDQRIVYALPRASFNAFKDKFERPVLTSSHTESQAAYLVGIHRVLSELEREHVA